jgi:hypothetical protein
MQIDFRKLADSTDFLQELRKLVPESERSKFDEWIEGQIEQHQEICDATVARMQQEVDKTVENKEDDDKKSEQ